MKKNITDLPPTILIRGEGIAGLTASHLLSRCGFAVQIEQGLPKPSPFILLTETTQWMLNDCWQLTESWWSTAFNIRQKQVIDKKGLKHLLPFSAKVVSQKKLQNTLQSILRKDHRSITWHKANQAPASEFEWTLNAIPKDTDIYTDFGSGIIISMIASSVGNNQQRQQCYMIEETKGWLFIFPINEKKICIQMMQTADKDYSIAHITQIIYKNTGLSVVISNTSVNIFSCSPKISNTLFSDNEIKIGRAAARYDPIGGDGAGHAIRSAVWAAKIIIAACQRNDVSKMLQHYSVSLNTHFYKHLETRASFYFPHPATPTHLEEHLEG